MNENNEKRNYIIAGALFALTVALHILEIVLGNLKIMLILCAVAFSLYCFLFKDKRILNTVSFGLALVFLILYHEGFHIKTDYSLDYMTIHFGPLAITVLLLCGALLLVKYRNERSLALISCIPVIIYTISTIIRTIVQDLRLVFLQAEMGIGFHWSLFGEVLTATLLLVALIYLWWLEGGHRIVDIIKGWKQTKQQFATLETSLRSLKEQFEGGQITQEEYDEQRKELLDQL